MPTIVDVAKEAGVGVGTVSRVLNDHPRVSPTTRAKVEAAIEKLGYRPNPLARALSTGHTTSVAVLVPYFTSDSAVLRIRGLVDALRNSKYQMTLHDVESAEAMQARLADPTALAFSAGLVVVSLRLDEIQLKGLRNLEAPTVLLDTLGAGFDSLSIDNVEGGSMATRHLIDLGHTRIAFLGDPETEGGFTSSRDRRIGYEHALSTAGLPVDPKLILRGPHGRSIAHKLTNTLLDTDDRPTAIFAASDTQALGVLEAARLRGLDVPEDLSVIGFDDVEVAQYVGLTTVRQPLYESGLMAGEMLLSRMSDPADAVVTRLPLEVTERTSTGPWRR